MIHIIYITTIVLTIVVTWHIAQLWYTYKYQEIFDEQYREIERLSNMEIEINQGT